MSKYILTFAVSRGTIVEFQEVPFSVKVANFLTTRKAQVTRYIKWVACLRVYRGLATPNRKADSSPLLFLIIIPLLAVGRSKTTKAWKQIRQNQLRNVPDVVRC